MTNKNFIMCGKYEVIRTLGTGSFSTVYLAKHLSLEIERAIKVAPRSAPGSDSLISEARLLMNIQHSGIPIIYDIEEDDQNIYLVEEYIQGESLEAFLLHQKYISQNLFLSFCEQLCGIFTYLHSLHPSPVIYRDLKPEHIIVCGIHLKIIDFGVSTYHNDTGNIFNFFGNSDFSAPELAAGSRGSVLSDIYSIGKIIQFMSDYQKDSVSRELLPVIQKAVSPEPACRYETVDMLLRAIRSANSKERQPHLINQIAVTGSYSGCGSTHLAISIVSVLNSLGKKAFYYEKNRSDSLRKMQEVQPGMTEHNGYYDYECFKGFPRYGPGILVPDPGAEISVFDYGTEAFSEEIFSAQLIVLVCGTAPWRLADAIEKEEFFKKHSDKLCFICNPGSRRIAHFYAKQFSAPVHSYFVDLDPFQITNEKIKFVTGLLTEKGQKFPCSIFDALKQKLRK